MLNFQPSIRQKIISGYLILLVLIAGFSLIIFIEIGYMERKVLSGEAIAEFFETTLEMRRFEKNYFLYGEESDLMENLDYSTRALRLLDDTHAGLKDVTYNYLTTQLKNDLIKYGELMKRYTQARKSHFSNNPPEPYAGPGDVSGPDKHPRRPGSGGTGSRPADTVEPERAGIRELGRSITSNAEKISVAQKKVMRKFLVRSRHFIVFSIVSLACLAIATGHVLSKMVAKPLKQLEISMSLIAEGGFEIIDIDSRDREISSLTKAFNKMLKEMEQKRRFLIQSEKLASLGTLLSGVAHELNNPLSNISSSCQILIEEIAVADPSYKMELLANIDSQTERARNIVRSILEFSRDGHTEKEKLSLSKLLDETIRFIRVQFPEGVEVRVNVSEDLLISAGRQRIQQVFLNLLKNAAEAVIPSSGDTGTTASIVSVAAQRQSVVQGCLSGSETCFKYGGECTFKGGAIDITISDTGTGIPSDALPYIFDPFFTTKDVGKGSGLGLFIVHEIIEEHSGCITVSSEEGKGTTFMIRLPDVQAETYSGAY